MITLINVKILCIVNDQPMDLRSLKRKFSLESDFKTSKKPWITSDAPPIKNDQYQTLPYVNPMNEQRMAYKCGLSNQSARFELGE